MSITKTLNQFKKEITENIPGLIALSVTEIETGISFISHSNDPNFDPELASSFNLEVAKAKMQAIEVLGINEKINDILINLEKQIHIIDISENYKYIIYVAVDSTKTNLGMTRALLSKYKSQLIKNL